MLNFDQWESATKYVCLEEILKHDCQFANLIFDTAENGAEQAQNEAQNEKKHESRMRFRMRGAIRAGLPPLCVE